MKQDNRFTERTYRQQFNAPDLVFFRIQTEQTDLMIGACEDLSDEALSEVARLRSELIETIRCIPQFLTALEPLDIAAITELRQQSELVNAMCRAAALAEVGPMAAVAGAVAGFVGKALAKLPNLAHVDIIVENGGDIYLTGVNERVVGIFAGESPLSGKLGIRIPPRQMPCGVCTSSGTVGHSLSFGNADAALVIASDPALSDAVATAMGNRIKQASDIAAALEWAMGIKGVVGVVGILGDQFGALGDVELVALT